MSVRLTHWTRGRLLITCTAFVCFAAIVTLSVRLAEIGGSGGLSKDGGRVVSDDGNISVAFAPHEIDEGTTIRINPRVIPPAVPAAPSLLRPVTPPFSIEAGGGVARSGIVTVRYPALPEGLDPSGLVMLIDEGTRWRILSTTVDQSAGTITARWPHFSIGIVAAWDWVSTPADWAKERLDEAASTLASHVSDVDSVRGRLAGALLASFGGAAHPVSCDPPDRAWVVRGRDGNGEEHRRPLLSGCVQGEGSGQSRELRIGNAHPYPFLVALPPGLNPDVLEVTGDADLADKISTFFWALNDRLVVPGGKESVASFNDTDVESELTLKGVLEQTTVYIRAVALIIAVLSRGNSTILKAEADRQTKALFDAMLARRKSNKEYRMSDYARDTSWSSAEARAQRRAASAQAVDATDGMFFIVDTLNCALAFLDQAKREAGLLEKLGELLAPCWPALLGKLTRGHPSMNGMDPADQLAEAKEAAGALIEQIFDIPRLISAQLATQLRLITRGKADLTHAQLYAYRDPFGDVDWPRAVRPYMGCNPASGEE